MKKDIPFDWLESYLFFSWSKKGYDFEALE
jgi:hypothetical protein